MTEKNATAYDTSAASPLAGASPMSVAALRRLAGDLPRGSMLEQEVIDVTKPADSYRHLEGGAFTIKAG